MPRYSPWLLASIGVSYDIKSGHICDCGLWHHNTIVLDQGFLTGGKSTRGKIYWKYAKANFNFWYYKTKVIMLHWIVVVPYFCSPKREQLRKLILSRPNMREYAENLQKNLKAHRKLWVSAWKPFLFWAHLKTCRNLWFSGVETLFFCRRSPQGSRKFVDHQEKEGKSCFFHLAGGKRDKKG